MRLRMFENILIHEGNRNAVNATNRFVDDKTGKYRFLFIYGPIGSGKTLLLDEIKNNLLENKKTVIKTTVMDICEKIRGNINDDQNANELLSIYGSFEVLIIDEDIELLKGKHGIQDLIGHFIKKFIEQGGKVIIASGTELSEYPDFMNKIESSLDVSSMVNIYHPEVNDRYELLKQWMSLNGDSIEDSYLWYLAERYNIVRELHGKLNMVLLERQIKIKDNDENNHSSLLEHKGNIKAVSAAKHFIDDKTDEKGLLFIYNSIGSVKTLLLDEIKNSLLEKKKTVIKTTVMDICECLGRDIYDSFNKHADKLLKIYGHFNVLIIDGDFEQLKCKLYTQVILGIFIKRLIRQGGKVVIASSTELSEYPDLMKKIEVYLDNFSMVKIYHPDTLLLK